MMRFLFWARIVGENMIFRYIWAPLRRLARMTQSQILLSLDGWFARQDDAASQRLRACQAEMVDSLDASRISGGIACFYVETGINSLLDRWWREEILPRVPEALLGFFAELFRYDLTTRPIYAGRPSDERLVLARTVVVNRESYYVLEGQVFAYDIPRLVESIQRFEECGFTPRRVVISLYYKMGFHNFISNHEFVMQFVGKTWQQLLDEKQVPEGRRLGSPASLIHQD